MSRIELAYGRGFFEFEFDEHRFSVLGSGTNTRAPLSDFEIGAAFDGVDEIAGADDSVLIVVSDATRATASAQVVNLLVRRLVQVGVSPARMAVIFATGIHRPVSEKERIELLTPFIAQRLRILQHDPHHRSKLTSLGKTECGVTLEVNSALKEFSRVFLTGGITFHYFAGFTGGRKSICPGLASAKTIEATHMLALDFERGGRKAGVGTGLLDGNAVHEECERVAALVAPAFGINTIVNEDKRAVKIFCGDWRLAHRAGCEYYLDQYSMTIPAKRDIVIASCGGFSHDINMIQAHKALDMAALACNEGGTIILLAECSDGLGRPDFMKWFDAAGSRAPVRRLVHRFGVYGQTAWALLTKAERYRVYLVSELADDEVKRMRMIPAHTLAAALDQAGAGSGFVLPRGAAVLPRLA